MSVYDLLIDVAIASILILAGQLLRAKIPAFQKFFVPASMIAGYRTGHGRTGTGNSAVFDLDWILRGGVDHSGFYHCRSQWI